MRKFKNKFAAIAAAAMTGVMTLGLVSAAAPVMGVYAEEGTTDTTSSDITITANGLTDGAVSMVQGSNLTFTATLVGNDNAQFTWAVTNRPSGVDAGDTKVAFDAIDANKLVVAADATLGAYVITATTGSGADVKTQTVTVTVTAAATNPGTTPGATTQTSATINYQTYTLKITGDTSAKYAFVELWKFGEKTATDFTSGENSRDKLSNVYSYELTNGEVTVDLSFLKASTAQGIKVYTDKNTAKQSYVIGAQPGKLSGLKYNSATKAFDTSRLKEGGQSLTTFNQALYEYRGQYATTWTALNLLTDIDHISGGSTIIIRKAATATAPAGPEAKIKISAAPKAPKVTVDYKKGTVKLSNKVEYAAKGAAYVEGSSTPITLTALRTTFNANATDELVVFVRTKENTTSGKPASNVTAVIIPAETTLTNANSIISVDGGDAGTKVTYQESTKGSGNNAKPIYEFKAEGAAFEFTEDAPTVASRKWKTVKANQTYTVELGEAPKTVYVRKAGVKGSAKDGSDSFFPSAEIPVPVPAKSSGTDKATAPSVNAGVVSVNNEAVLTIARNAQTNTTIDFNVTAGKQTVVDTLEYKIGTAEYASIPEAGLPGQGTAEITIQIRVKAADGKEASDAVDVIIAAVSGGSGEQPAQKQPAPTINVANGQVSVGDAVVATISRDDTNGKIKITLGQDGEDVIEYSVDGGSNWTSVATNIADIAENNTSIQLRTAAADSKTASDALTVGVPANLAEGDVTVARDETINTTIKFTVNGSLTATLEYSVDEGASWSEITDAKEIADQSGAVTILVRVKANDTNKAIASNSLTFEVSAVSD